MGNKEVRPFGMRDKIGYGLGDFGCNMSFAFINNYLMVFYVTCMGIKAKHFAIIILLAKIFDAINDPIIGGICDASKPGKDGKFKPWIKWASLPLLVSSILMFIYAPNAPYALKIAMCLGLYCVWSVAYTSVNVPYGSMQSVITTQSDERSSLSTWRSVGAMLAQIPVMVLLPKLVYDSKTSNPRGNVFIYIVGVMGLIGFVSFILLRKLTTERVEPTVNNVQKFNYFKTLASFFKNKPMMGVTISSVAYLALMMTVTNSMQYVFMCYFKNTKIIPIATVIAGLPIGLGIVITKPLLKKFTKKQLCTYPFAISAVAAGIATFVRFDNPYVWIAFIGVSMFGTCFYLTLMWALVADCIDYQEEKTGRREEGSIYATYSLFRKIAQGVGASIIALSLDLTGYSEKLDALSQAEGVPEKIYTMTGALPLIGALICLFSMHFLYNIKDKKSEE
ncbi:MFS transporter [Eubacterium coprostanoligenes]|uniref:Glycoside/pentoside/hexuronide:cation symporter, GPH family n=1 Tax=Eubacterium coprostanoligenes TaxID=290054 RepID=A0A1T4LA89_9FIRM|nr:MFS transporter [Eubacterium coprostanoligenes]MDY5377113.1 MFS transporter [Eubacterium coprostanoligenes]SJZ51530.1 glycoside/pentoside/hexuronide:cation symporter, GPH family [Eubacterium coprostanoligenes]